MKVRNREVNLYRILFAIIVVVSHSHGLRPSDPTRYPFCGGYLAVEFFFMLTGYFAERKAEQARDEERIAYHSVAWTGKKFLRLYTYVIPAVFIHYLVNAWLRKLSAFETIKSLLYGSFEALLLPETGIYETFLVAPLWYLSSLLLILPLFYFAAMKLRETFLYLISPFSILLIYGYFSATYGHMDLWGKWTGCFFLSLPRTWADLCLGGLCYFFSKRLREVKITRSGERVLCGIKFLCLTGALLYMFTRYHRRLDFLCIGMLFLFLIITLSKIEDTAKGGSSFLAEYSLALYVSHWTIRDIIPSMMTESTYEEMLGPYLFFSLLYAGLLVVGVKGVQRLSLPQKLKHCFINEGEIRKEQEI